MRPPARWNLTIYQGATFRAWRRWRTGADADSAQPVQLSGCTARMQLRENVQDTRVLLELSTANGGLTLGAQPGRIDLFLSARDTAALDFERAVYDLEITFPNGDVRRLLSGRVRVHPEVTR